MYLKLPSRGFTLIELLVVIAIIGLLSSVVLASLNSARAKAKDVKRVSDLKQISLALELYYDTNRTYPNPGWGWRSQCNAWGAFTADQVIPGLVPTYMSSFPTDPEMNAGASTCCYLYLSNGTDYKALVPHGCGTANFLSQPSLVDPTRDGIAGSDGCAYYAGSLPWAWHTSSPGGYCW